MDVIRDNLVMESTTSVSVSSVASSLKNQMAFYIALKANFVVMVLISLTFFIGHWDRGEVFSFVTLTDKNWIIRKFAVCASRLLASRKP